MFEKAGDRKADLSLFVLFPQLQVRKTDEQQG